MRSPINSRINSSTGEVEEGGSDEEEAVIMFRSLYSPIFAEKGGRPKYPEFSWRDAEALVTMYKDDLKTLRRTSSFSEKELVRARITS